MSRAAGGLVIGVDASALAGGGLTHLRGILQCARPHEHGISRIRVWAPRRLLDQLPDASWLERLSVPAIEGARWRRLVWQRLALRDALAGCDLFWSPGLFAPFRFDPMVVMTQNSLLFDEDEQRRYGWSMVRLRLRVLARSQRRSLRHAAGVIFLSEWGEALVRRSIPVTGPTAVIPHGIDTSFLAEPRRQEPLDAYSASRPFRLLYVSMIDLYKHPWHVAQAVADLRRAGLPLELTLAGPAYAPALRRLDRTLDAIDPERRFVHYVGSVPYDELPALYRRSDLCVFASTCENLPNILLEAMGSAMPIACSDRSPMREVIGDGGVLFDPESPAAIATAIERMATDPTLRQRCAERARALAAPYTWQRCADDTLAFLAQVARAHARSDFHQSRSLS